MAGSVVSEAEFIDRGDLAHAASIPCPENRFQWPAPEATMKTGVTAPVLLLLGEASPAPVARPG
jgi:hypothetical protein